MRNATACIRAVSRCCAIMLATLAIGAKAQGPAGQTPRLVLLAFKPIPKPIPGVGDAVKPPTAKMPDRPDLSRSVGPLIKNFGVLAGACPYPDPQGRLLWYRVDPAPDGTPVARIEVIRNLAAGTAVVTYRVPGPGTTEANLSRHSGVVDPAPNPTTRGFALRATDARGRSTLAHVAFAYREPPAAGRNAHVLAVERHRAATLTDRDRVSVRFAVNGVGIRRVGLDHVLPPHLGLSPGGPGPGIDGTIYGQSLPIRFSATRRDFEAHFELGPPSAPRLGSDWLVIDVQGPPSCSSEVRLLPLRLELRGR